MLNYAEYQVVKGRVHWNRFRSATSYNIIVPPFGRFFHVLFPGFDAVVFMASPGNVKADLSGVLQRLPESVPLAVVRPMEENIVLYCDSTLY